MLYQSLTGALPFEGPPQRIIARQAGRAGPAPRRTGGVPCRPTSSASAASCSSASPKRRPDGREILARLEERPHAFVDPPPRAATITSSDEPASSPPCGRRSRPAAPARPRSSFAASRGSARPPCSARSWATLERRPRRWSFAGRCYEREFVPFKALDGAIDALARHLDGLDEAALQRLLPPGAAALARIFPVLRRACYRAGLVMDDASPASPTDARRPAFRALRRLLGTLARRAPIVLAIDDLHWADVDSLRALERSDARAAPAADLAAVLGAHSERRPRACRARSSPSSGPRAAARRGGARAGPPAARRAAGPTTPARPALIWLAEEAVATRCSWRRCSATAPPGTAARCGSRTRWRRGSRRCPPRRAALVEVVSLATHPLWTAALARAVGAAPNRCSVVRDLQVDRLVRRGAKGTRLRSSLSDHSGGPVILAPCSPSASGLPPQHRPDPRAPRAQASDPWSSTGAPPGIGARAPPRERAGHHAHDSALAFNRAATYYQTAMDLRAEPAADPASSTAGTPRPSARPGRRRIGDRLPSRGRRATAGDEQTELARSRRSSSCAPASGPGRGGGRNGSASGRGCPGPAT